MLLKLQGRMNEVENMPDLSQTKTQPFIEKSLWSVSCTACIYYLCPECDCKLLGKADTWMDSYIIKVRGGNKFKQALIIPILLFFLKSLDC